MHVTVSTMWVCFFGSLKIFFYPQPSKPVDLADAKARKDRLEPDNVGVDSEVQPDVGNSVDDVRGNGQRDQADALALHDGLLQLSGVQPEPETHQQHRFFSQRRLPRCREQPWCSESFQVGILSLYRHIL